MPNNTEVKSNRERYTERLKAKYPDREFADDEPLPIGHACRNTDIFLLKDNRLAEPGESGEVCVRGRCLALGYYNNPEKTEEAFIQNPLNPYYPEKIYKTGDIAKYNEYGEIIFLARKDHQITATTEIYTLYLNAALPIYVMIQMESLPQTLNGKIDRLRLREYYVQENS